MRQDLPQWRAARGDGKVNAMVPDSELRASDRERDEVVSRLADHLAEGRLELAEFEERSTRASTARTRGELAELTVDLPSSDPAPAPAPTAPPSLTKDEPPARRPGAGLRPYRPWLAAGLTCVAVWAISSAAAGTVLPFWPIWVIGPWGFFLLLRVVRSSTGRG